MRITQGLNLAALLMLAMLVGFTGVGLAEESGDETIREERIYTIYKKDNSWIQGTELKIDYIFNEKYYLISDRDSSRPTRVKDEDVFKVVDQESIDKEERIKYHMKRGKESHDKKFYDVAVREFEKVLSIDPLNIEARNLLVQVLDESNIRLRPDSPLTRANSAQTDDDDGELSPEDFQKMVGLREDQIAFLKMVSSAHNIEYKRLVAQAVENWIQDYKDYKIQQDPELPKLRHKLIPQN